MAAAVGGITMMGQQAAPVQAHEFVRTTMPQERVMARDFQFQVSKRIRGKFRHELHLRTTVSST